MKRRYVQIAAEEIAPDYPEPRQYVTTEEELDELMHMLVDEETVGEDPDTLPLFSLTDFAIYNGEVGTASVLQWRIAVY